MATVKFGFIGSGNMGSALARAVCKAVGSDEVVVSDKSAVKAQLLADELGCTAADVSIVASTAQYIFLGVKPQVMNSALKEIAPILAARQDRFVLVTMAAGLKMAEFDNMLDAQYPIIRIMPNTPVSKGKGMILYCANKRVYMDELSEFVNSLKFAGKVDNIDEGLIDAASAVSGCGPAFVYLFAKHLANAGVNCGLDAEKAIKYAAQTLSGAAELLLTSVHSADELIDMVCSPGGSTIEGVKSFNASTFEENIKTAVNASFEKTKLLGK